MVVELKRTSRGRAIGNILGLFNNADMVNQASEVLPLGVYAIKMQKTSGSEWL